MAKKSKNAASSFDPNLNLGQLSLRYLDHMQAEGKSASTCFSYTQELKSAIAELGADTIVSEITPALIEKFNASDRVMRLKSGKPKAAPSYLKTQRVLRLALAFAEQSGLIAKSPVTSKYDAMPEVLPAPIKPWKGHKAKAVATDDAPAPAPEEVAAPAA